MEQGININTSNSRFAGTGICFWKKSWADVKELRDLLMLSANGNGKIPVVIYPDAVGYNWASAFGYSPGRSWLSIKITEITRKSVRK